MEDMLELVVAGLFGHGTIYITLGVFLTLSIVIVRTIGGTIRSVARERTRREIAAYIAEGSMSPEQGERLMKAGGSTVA